MMILIMSKLLKLYPKMIHCSVLYLTRQMKRLSLLQIVRNQFFFLIQTLSQIKVLQYMMIFHLMSVTNYLVLHNIFFIIRFFSTFFFCYYLTIFLSSIILLIIHNILTAVYAKRMAIMSSSPIDQKKRHKTSSITFDDENSSVNINISYDMELSYIKYVHLQHFQNNDNGES